MKKVIYLVGLFVLLVLPLNVLAAELKQSGIVCKDGTASGTKVCTVSLDTGNEALSTMEFTITPKGGAELLDVTQKLGTEWTLNDDHGTTSRKLVFTNDLDSQSGEMTVFEFTYKVSGSEDCEVNISFAGKTVTTTPDTPTPQKQTGSTLPFVALGSILALAGLAYVSTKNKAKMFKI